MGLYAARKGGSCSERGRKEVAGSKERADVRAISPNILVHSAAKLSPTSPKKITNVTSVPAFVPNPQRKKQTSEDMAQLPMMTVWIG